MQIHPRTFYVPLALFAALFAWHGTCAASEEEAVLQVYDEASYTQYVEDTMAKLDRLYLEFCRECDVDAARAHQARQEFMVLSRELMKQMNAKFDGLDPKLGAALSPRDIGEHPCNDHAGRHHGGEPDGALGGAPLHPVTSRPFGLGA